jgi:hypothetical protein
LGHTDYFERKDFIGRNGRKKTKESKKLQLFLERSKDSLSALDEIRSGILL